MQQLASAEVQRRRGRARREGGEGGGGGGGGTRRGLNSAGAPVKHIGTVLLMLSSRTCRLAQSASPYQLP
jgi:hypothetical protein